MNRPQLDRILLSVQIKYAGRPRVIACPNTVQTLW